MPWFYKFLPHGCAKIFVVTKGDGFISTIYIDVLFFINLAINFSLLMCMRCILKLPLKSFRLLLGGCTGALYSCLVYTVNLPFMSSAIMRLAFAVAIVGVSFGFSGTASLVKRTFLFIALTIAMGVAMLGLLYFTNMGIRLGGVIKNGVFYFNIPLKYMVFCSVGAYILVYCLEKVFKKASYRSFSRVKIYRYGKAVELTALIDTGNMLCDPLSGRKVLIAEAEMLSPLFAFCIEDILKEGFKPEVLPEGFRLIPYNSIGKKDGLLVAFVPDLVEIDSKKANNIITAVFDGVLSSSGDYNALIGPNML